MSGLGDFFGFEGRINRLGIVWRAAVVGVGLAALAAAGAVALTTYGPGGIGDFQTWTQRLTLAVILLGLWAGFALATRRLRDMGVEPTYVAPAYAALWVANEQLLAPLSRLEPQSYGPIETAWIVAQVVLGLVLIAWPSRTGEAHQPTVAFAAPAATSLNWRESG
jgi:uncharacterized membrane protein YhaH (DUF805 family)